MDKKRFEIWERLRRKRLADELEDIAEDSGGKGTAISGMRIRAEKKASDQAEDEIAMEKATTEIEEEEIKGKRQERKNLIWTNRVLAFIAIASFMVSTTLSILTNQNMTIQTQANLQSLNLNYLKSAPNLGESFDAKTWKLTLTNYGELAINIDSATIGNKKIIFPIHEDIFPGKSINEDLHPILAMANLFPPKGSSTIAEYRIFFTTANTNGPIYMGQLPLVMDNFLTDHFQILVPIQSVSIQRLSETNFQDLYKEIAP
jgi:hypothetical protein